MFFCSFDMVHFGHANALRQVRFIRSLMDCVGMLLRANMPCINSWWSCLDFYKVVKTDSRFIARLRNFLKFDYREPSWLICFSDSLDFCCVKKFKAQKIFRPDKLVWTMLTLYFLSFLAYRSKKTRLVWIFISVFVESYDRCADLHVYCVFCQLSYWLI